jgi:hypothetical protein
MKRNLMNKSKLPRNLPAVDRQGVGAVMPGSTNINPMNPTQWTSEKKVRPNEKCPCGSGKKYKKCCMYNLES